MTIKKNEKIKRFAWTAKVGDKGQIVIPKEAREIFNITSGDTLLLLGDTEQGIAIVNYEDYANLMPPVFGKRKK